MGAHRITITGFAQSRATPLRVNGAAIATIEVGATIELDDAGLEALSQMNVAFTREALPDEAGAPADTAGGGTPADAQGGGSPALSDAELTALLALSVDNLKLQLGGLTADQLRVLLAAEQAGKNRVTAVEAIEQALEQA